MAISEKVELLGKGTYTDIPDVLTLTSLPTLSELDMVGSEEFEKTMIENILPKCVEETVNFGELLEIDFQWVCRCLRLLNYGPYHTTNLIICGDCGQTSYGEFQVDLQTIGVKPLPDNFVNDIIIKKDEFIDFKGDIHLKLPTIREILNSEKDTAFKRADGSTNRELARICYMIKSMGQRENITPIDVKVAIAKDLSPADYIVLKAKAEELTDYGLRAGGKCQCPKCGSKEASFIALMDDKFFRPTLGDLREWANTRSRRKK